MTYEEDPESVDERRRRLEWLHGELRARSLRHGSAIASGQLDLDAPGIVGVRAWMTDPHHCILVLAGPPGTGKTLSAMWWMREHAVAYKWHRPLWTTATAFALMQRWETEDDNARQVVLKGNALVLDDLGAEHLAGALPSDLDQLIDSYYSRCARLLVTTNLDGEQFRARYGERIADRIAEAGRWVRVTGPSRRAPRSETR
jgi:DNA replication protein DnaC